MHAYYVLLPKLAYLAALFSKG